MKMLKNITSILIVKKTSMLSLREIKIPRSLSTNLYSAA